MMRRFGNQSSTCVACVCPYCKTLRYVPANVAANGIQRGTFTGHCNSCSPALRRNGATPGRSVNSQGYVSITRPSVIAEWRDYFDPMRGGRASVMEHRLVMAAALGRPLESWECVDHMNGIKTDNSIENLRVYRTGRNDPGSCSGWGTFYHEWQMALAEIERLRAA